MIIAANILIFIVNKKAVFSHYLITEKIYTSVKLAHRKKRQVEYTMM